MENNQKLFLLSHAGKHENIMKGKIRKFILGYKSLENFLLLETDPNDVMSLQFYSSLYVEMAPILTEVTCFVINNGYTGRRKRVDYAIIISQKILGLLKILHTRYVTSITSPNPIEDYRWYGVSEKSNVEIVDGVYKLLDKMYSFKTEE